MKKTSLLLLIPSLFLFTSCAKAPVVDTIDENAAREFIKEKYSKATPKAPSLETLVNWKITKDDKDKKIQKLVNLYVINNDKNPAGETGKKVKINQNRANAFKTELEDLDDPTPFGQIGTDAIVTLNPEIYKVLYKSQGTDDFSLIYRYAGSGLKITSQLNTPTTTFTRVHTYNKYGYETRFELTVSNEEYNYTLNINFKY